jgi:hypothetical protein
MTNKKATKATAKKLVREHCADLVPGSVEIHDGRIWLWLETAEGETNDREALEKLADKLADLLGRPGWQSNGSWFSVRYAGDSPTVNPELVGFADPMHY